MADIAKRIKASLVTEIDPHELACVIAEAVIGCRRPDGATPQIVMQQFDPEIRQGFYEAAKNAALYMTTCINNVQRLN